jgi:hypothetical protein
MKGRAGRQRYASTMKKPAKHSSRKAEQSDYRACKLEAAAELADRHDVKPGIIPERLWRKLYIQGMAPQEAARHVAVSIYNAQSAADRLKRR